jgi:DNA-directed RNA polymerase specialized sigma subunit
MSPEVNGEPANELAEAAREEEEFVRQQLKEELGREPSEDELNEWLREHTESY